MNRRGGGKRRKKMKINVLKLRHPQGRSLMKLKTKLNDKEKE